MKNTSKACRIFAIFNYSFLGILTLTCLMPLIHIFAVSVSDKAAVDANLVSFRPVGFTLESYTKAVAGRSFIKALLIGAARTLCGPLISMPVTLMAAYSLEKEKSEFKWRNTYMWFFVFAMIFNGGLIPTYMVVRLIGFIDTFWALILPCALQVNYMLLLVNFFRSSIPRSLKDTAQIDGASHIKILSLVYLPLATPAIATILLFNIVFHWNSYFDGLIYILKTDLYPLAAYLQTLIVSEKYANAGLENLETGNVSARSIRAANIIIGAAPVLLAYPFVQRYFVAGIVPGSVKG